MALRFNKRLKIAPGVKLNISKSGISTTIGPKGASVNVGKKGTHLNAGIPGTGLSSRTKLSGGKNDSGDSPGGSFVQTVLGAGIGVAAVIGLLVWLL